MSVVLILDGWAKAGDARVRCARTGLHRRDDPDHCASLYRVGIEPSLTRELHPAALSTRLEGGTLCP